MADDWDTVTKIGTKARTGATHRETVVRGKSALNAAQRSGAIVGTEKKFGAGNSASSADGQRMAKVDRADDVVKVPKVDKTVGDVIKEKRSKEPYKMTQKELAQKCNCTATVIQELEAGNAKPDPKVLHSIERVLNVQLTGPNFRKKRNESKP